MQKKASFLKTLVLPGIIGNILEWFEFSLYGYFAPILAQLFFPARETWISFIQTFAVFAAGFLMRPLGALIFGHLGDTLGRQKTLSLSILMMAVPTTCVGLLPTYQQIGFWASLLLLLLRLIQGVAIGGEFGGSLVYVLEHAPPHRRGLYTSWTKFGLFVGVFLGSGTAAFMGHVLSPADLASWGWRLPFLAGIPLGLIGYYLRHNLPETPYFLELQEKRLSSKTPLLTALKQAPGKMFIGILLAILATVSFYLLFVFLPTYMKTYAHLSFSKAMIANTLSMAIAVLGLPLIGWLSDCIGRRPCLIVSALGFMIFSYPLFVMLTQAHSLATALLPQVILSLLLLPSAGVSMTVIIEMFPTRIRYSAASFSINMAIALFGGTTPLIVTWLITAAHLIAAPSFYLIAAGTISLIAILCIPETHKISL